MDDSARRMAAVIALADHEGTLAEHDLSPGGLAAAHRQSPGAAAEALELLSQSGLGDGGSDTLTVLAAAGLAGRLAEDHPADAGGHRRLERALLGAAARADGGRLQRSDGLLLRSARQQLAGASLFAAPLTIVAPLMIVAPTAAGPGPVADPAAASWPDGPAGQVARPRPHAAGRARAGGHPPPRPSASP